MDYGQIKLYLYASYLLSTIRVIEYCVEKCKLKSSFNKSIKGMRGSGTN